MDFGYAEHVPELVSLDSSILLGDGSSRQKFQVRVEVVGFELTFSSKFTVAVYSMELFWVDYFLQMRWMRWNDRYLQRCS